MVDRPRSRRYGKWVLIALVVWLSVDKAISILRSEPEVGYWRSQAGRAAYAQAYRNALAELPAPDATLDVPTSFGSVRALRWDGKDASATPVLLLPGRSSGIPMWSENLSEWIGQRDIYAVDPIGDAGLSNQSTPLADFEAQGSWISETISGLGLTRVHAVGHSFGGANAAILAVTHPDQVASLTLIEPVFVLAPLPLSTFFWAAVTQLPVPQDWRDRALAEIGGVGLDEVRERTPLSSMIDLGTQHFRAALPTPRTLTDAELAGLSMPVRIDLGGSQSLAGAGAADRVRTLLPDSTVTTWPDATHSLPMQESGALGAALLDFWGRA